ncbi:MAG: HlyD family efflux transporter periplasmic adaptor subunit [Pseudomonadota bacterium]|jgi:Multidrug resistance efflux pump|nr:MAG: efflux transporter periplasmic adaptor subunit [Pseudomonadota bacterium]
MDATIRRRLTFWAPFVLALLLALAWLFRPQPVPVDLATVERGPLLVTVSDDGETRVRDVFAVSAPIAGLMRRIELEVGDPVEAQRTVIARIEPSDPAFLDPRSAAEARAARDAAAAARAYAQAQLERMLAERDFAISEYERIESLAERQVVSQNEREAAQRRARAAIAAVEEARAALRMRESELEQAKARLIAPGRSTPATEGDCNCIRVYSPVSGTVLRINSRSERVVTPGELLVEVGDPRRLEIVVDLLSEDAVRVRAGQRAIIEGWGGEEPLEGTVRRVEPFGFMRVSALGIEEQRVNVIIDITSPRERWQRLGHGYRVVPSIVLWEAQDVLLVPLSALFRQGESWAVFVAENGRAKLRTVEIGQQNGLVAEVRSGLEPGERVVLHPGDRVTDGTRITPRGSG